MTINEMRNILQAENIDLSIYMIPEDTHLLGDTYLALEHYKNGFRVMLIERMQPIEIEYFLDEDSACTYMLKELSSEYPKLKKWLI